MNNDMIGICMAQVASYDKEHKMHSFTAKQLSDEICRISKVDMPVTGQIIFTVLNGRSDVVILGSGYYGLVF